MTDVLETINEVVVVTTDDGMQLMTVAEQGPEGAPYSTLQGNFYFGVVADSVKPIVPSAIYSFTFDELRGLKTATGTCTLSILIDDVAITGMDSIAVTTVAQDVTATALNLADVGDRVTVSIADVTNTTGLEFSAKGTLN